MNKTAITFILFCFILNAFSQTFETDSLGIDYYINHAQFQKAIELIDEQAETKDLLFKKALCFISLKNNGKAIEILDSLSNQYPEDVRIKLQLAGCYESESLYSKGIECYENLLSADSTNIYFKIQIADLLFQSRKYAEALRWYQEIESDYKPQYIYAKMAKCYEITNQIDSAKINYDLAWELNPLDSYSAANLIKIEMKEKDYFTAVQNSEWFLSMDSTNIEISILNALVYYNLEDYEFAATRFEQCKMLGDSSLIVNRGLGLSHYFLKNDSNAVVSLQKAYTQDTTNNTVLHALAISYQNLGFHQESIDCYELLLERTIPKDQTLYLLYKGIAQSYEGKKLDEDAVQNYILALKYAIQSQKIDILYKLSFLYDIKLNHFNSACYYYDMYLENLKIYQKFLKEQDPIDSARLEEVDSTIIELEKYIVSYKKHGSNP